MSQAVNRALRPSFEESIVGAPAKADNFAAASAPSSTPIESATVSSIAPYGGDAYALTSRRAARINAAHTSSAELDRWMQERKELLDKLFDGSISSAERTRLRYVRWNIDKIQDARSGEILDVLEGFVAKYEQFRDDLKDFGQQLDGFRHR